MKYKPDWPEARKRLEALWHGEMLDRPCVAVTAPLPSSQRRQDTVPVPVNAEGQWLDPSYRVAVALREMENKWWGGESVPSSLLMANWVICLGGTPQFDDKTIWFDTQPVDFEKPSPFRHDPQSEWTLKHRKLLTAMLDAAGRDNFLIGKSGGLPANDLLSMMMGTTEFVLALMDHPEWMAEAILTGARDQQAVRRELADLIRARHDFWYGLAGWMPFWAPEPFNVTQSDVSCMLSREAFKRFILPELELCGSDHGALWYHLDGGNAKQHLPCLLSLPFLRVLQYTPAPCEPPNGPGHLDFYKEVQRAGKIVHIHLPKENVEPLVRELDPRRLMLQTDCGTPDEGMRLLDSVKKWACRLLVACACLGAADAGAQAELLHRELPDAPVVAFPWPGAEPRIDDGMPATAAPTVAYSHGDPTSAEQLMLEMVNRARLDPAAEGVRLASVTNADILGAYDYYGVSTNQLIDDFAGYPARPPIAFNAELIAAARAHSTDMADNDFQSHTGSNGSGLSDRLSTAGYTGWSSAGENVYAYSLNIFYGHAGFNADWGVASLGHRENIMNYGDTVYNEIGIGIVLETNLQTTVGPQVTTQDFGKRTACKYLLGVVYCDADGDGFYSEGEGVEGATVMPDTGTYYAVTSASGGYAVPLNMAQSDLIVSISGGGIAAPESKSVTVSDENVKLDFTVSTNGSAGPSGPGSGNLTNLVLYYESTGYWYVFNSTGDVSSLKLGDSGYAPVPADYDGDGKSDLAVYHESSGYWYVLLSSDYSLSYQKFGETGYSPVTGDYDGDGKSDLAVYHESSGYWYILLSSDYSLSCQKFGEPGYSPVSADYDGDNKSDLAVYHESSGYWYVLLSTDYSLSYQKFGEPGYSPVAADYDGDGKSDLAVYHEISGYWYILYSSSYELGYLKFGESGYSPVPGDYDGDGKADLAVYHESSGYWYVFLSGDYSLGYQEFGGLGYVAVGPM